ncbi:MAG: hypothetical protein DRG87_05800 [Deltaproteobacteria bacterium]|nr:MAG: hypothetical protein DRG87_05800 [Deltaproteobacteria bacterium]
MDKYAITFFIIDYDCQVAIDWLWWHSRLHLYNPFDCKAALIGAIAMIDLSLTMFIPPSPKKPGNV